jgi:hypothetical protein
MPWLKYVPPWVPGANFKRLAHKWRQLVMEALEKPYEAAKKHTVPVSLLIVRTAETSE